VAHALLEDVNLIDGMKIYRIDGKTIKRVRGQTDDAAALQASYDIFDFFRLRFVRMHPQ
jgi:hypothetical protein